MRKRVRMPLPHVLKCARRVYTTFAFNLNTEMTKMLIRLCLAFTFLLGTASFAQPEPSYVPHRVYDAKEKRFTDFEAMVADLSRADIVFIGEQHDDPSTHRL